MTSNIVIIGAGFAGIRAALKIEGGLKSLQSDWRIILIDRNSYHLFTPALHEVATAYNLKHIDEGQIFEGLIGSAVALPVSSILRDKNISFVRGEVSGIDFAGKAVRTEGGDLIDFEYLILALGSETTNFGVPGVKECCYGIKTFKDAVFIRRRLKEIFAAKKENINIIVVGAGFSGVEIAAEIALYIKHLAREYKINKSEISVSIMEAGDKILQQANFEPRKAVEKRLKKLGVNIRVNTKVREALPGCVVTGAEESCEADIVIWSGGIKGPSLFEKFEGIELGKSGRIAVDEFMRAREAEGVFAVGDNALFIDENGAEAPPTAFVAEQQADIAARNILSEISGGKARKYKIYIPGYATSVGGKYAVDRIFGITFSGYLGWFVKHLINLRYFLSILPIKKALALWWQELRLFTRND